MSKTIYDVIQRFEVEDGVPRLISTNIQVIEGGEDLMSLAANLLKQLGFYDKFEEKRTSQYIGYRVKKPRKGDKRYQLVFSPAKREFIYFYSPRQLRRPYLLNFKYHVVIQNRTVTGWQKQSWILPSKKYKFLTSLNVRFSTLLEEF